jgi:alkyl sulfatase BDS1-like metallo-beta-lactamase superfamily hydrolase
MLIYVIFADPDNAEAKSLQADTSSSSGTGGRVDRRSAL